MPLSPLQSDIARTIARLPEAEGFALAGGGALVVLGVVDRPTRDLDYFGTAPDAVDQLRAPLEHALRGQGFVIEMRRAVPGYVEYQVTRGEESTALDVTWDTRLRAPQQTALGSVLAEDDLAADKTLALFGRSEARDYVDVFKLRAHYGRDDLCRLATEKDRGFDLAVFDDALARIDRHDRSDFPIDEHDYTSLRAEFAAWRDELARELARQAQPRIDVDPDPPTLDL